MSETLLGSHNPHKPPVPRDDIPGLRNFACVTRELFRGGQPTRDGYVRLRDAGIRSVVNLRTSHKDRELLRDFDFDYYHVRCRAWWPSSARLAEILSIVKGAKPPVFVHCLHGCDRTGLAMAAFRIIEQNWTREQAIDELRRFGFHGKIFPQIGAYLRRLNEEKIAEHFEMLPPHPEPLRNGGNGRYFAGVAERR